MSVAATEQLAIQRSAQLRYYQSAPFARLSVPGGIVDVAWQYAVKFNPLPYDALVMFTKLALERLKKIV